MEHTPGPWKWQGEDYRGGWGWQLLVGPNGEGLIVGDENGDLCKHLKAYMPVEPELCITGMLADGKPHVNAVHVFNEANAKLIAAAPELLEELERMVASAENNRIPLTGRARSVISKVKGE
jgi:hypothetical protein